MHFIVYLSDFTGCNQTAESVLQDICESSQRNNLQRQITGALFYHRGTFLQAIEGPKDNLEELMQVLHQDRRHKCIRLIVNEVISRRSFSDWNMDSFDLTHADLIEEQTLEKFRQVFLSQMKMEGMAFIKLLKSVLQTPSLVKS